jgi:signal peptidase I
MIHWFHTNKSLWREWRAFLLFIAIMLVFRSAIADWNQVPSGSMKPSILVGDRIVVDKLAYDLRVPFTLRRIVRWAEPRRGDVVTFPSPVDERLFVKRIVGLPGDIVELRNNRVIVNGEHATYTELTTEEVEQIELPNKRGYRFEHESFGEVSYIVMFKRGLSATPYQSFAPVTVPDNHFLMLGDNRDDSRDYRAIGWVERDRILGRAKAIAFSLNYDNYYAPRMNRFFESL